MKSIILEWTNVFNFFLFLLCCVSNVLFVCFSCKRKQIANLTFCGCFFVLIPLRGEYRNVCYRFKFFCNRIWFRLKQIKKNCLSQKLYKHFNSSKVDRNMFNLESKWTKLTKYEEIYRVFSFKISVLIILFWVNYFLIRENDRTIFVIYWSTFLGILLN